MTAVITNDGVDIRNTVSVTDRLVAAWDGMTAAIGASRGDERAAAISGHVFELAYREAGSAIAAARASGMKIDEIISEVKGHGEKLSRGTFPVYEAVGKILALSGDLPDDFVVRTHVVGNNSAFAEVPKIDSEGNPVVVKEQVEKITARSLATTVAAVNRVNGIKELTAVIDASETKVQACRALAKLADFKEKPVAKTMAERVHAMVGPAEAAVDEDKTPAIGDTETLSADIAAIRAALLAVEARMAAVTAV